MTESVMDKAIAPLILKDLFDASGLEDIAWRKFHEGIEIHVLHATPDGASAALLRYHPGAQLPRHAHRGYEHIVVLHGSQVDDAGEHHRGTAIIYPPGSSHSIRSPGGCVVLIMWERPVLFLPQANSIEESQP